MSRFKSLFYSLSVCLGIIFILSISSASAFAADKPEIFVQLGHSGRAVALTLSPDGKYLVSAFGKTITVWNAETGREIRTLFGCKAEIEHVGISSDGKTVIAFDNVSSGIGHVIKIWDLLTGADLKTIELPSMKITDAELKVIESASNNLASSAELKTIDWSSKKFAMPSLVSHDARYVMYIMELLTINGGKHDGMYLFDVTKNQKISILNKEDLSMLLDVKLSRNIKYISVLLNNGVIKIYETNSGRLVKQINGIVKINDPFMGQFRIEDITNDGKFIIIDGRDSDHRVIKILINCNNDKTIRTKTLYKYNSSPATFTLDGRHVLWTENNQYAESGPKYKLYLEEIESGRNVWSWDALPESVNCFYVAHDGRTMLAGLWDGTIKMLDTTTGKELQTFSGNAITHRLFSYAPSANLMLSGVNLWNTATGHLVTKYQGVDKSDLILSPDGKMVLDKEHKLLFDAQTGASTNVFPDEKGFLFEFKTSFSSDGRYILSDFEGTLKLWDILNRQVVFSYTTRDGFPGTAACAITPDGERIIYSVGNDEGKNILASVDIKSGKNLWQSLLGDKIMVSSFSPLSFSPDGKYILISDGLNNRPILFDTAGGRLIKEFKHRDNRIGMGAVATYSPNGKYILSSNSFDETITLWDVASGKEEMSIVGHKGGVFALAFTQDNKNFLSASNDGTTRLWDISTGKEIVQFINFTDGEWIVITPEGYFNASPNGAKHLNVRVGNNVYSIDNFYEKFFNPVYVASVLQGKKVEAVADIRKGILTPPDVKITSPEPNKEFSTDTVTITVSAKDTGGGIDEIRLYHNGKAIGEDTRGVKIIPKGNEAVKTYTVNLVDGANTFRATAFSKDRTESNPYELIVKLTAPQKDVSMYIFAVGINKYKNPALNLNYAEPDAKGIADFFRGKGAGLFKKVEIKEICNEQATKETIISKLNQLQNTNPQDAVLIYLAGHGENINDKWYFIPHELTYPEREEDVKAKGISSDELSGYIKNIKAQKILLLIDSCKSGAVLIAFRGFEDRKALSQLSRSTGVHIVAASTKDQFAAEVKELGHGVFTYTLLEGLKGKAAGGGKTVTVFKLKAYIDEQLPEITKKYRQEAQYPVGDSSIGAMDFPLVIVK